MDESEGVEVLGWRGAKDSCRGGVACSAGDAPASRWAWPPSAGLDESSDDSEELDQRVPLSGSP